MTAPEWFCSRCGSQIPSAKVTATVDPRYGLARCGCTTARGIPAVRDRAQAMRLVAERKSKP